jgi:hypothetical protein
MSTKTIIIVFVVAVACAFASGRLLAPVKVVTKVVEVEKKVETTATQKDEHKETTVVETQRPDGTKQTTTKIVEDASTHAKTAETDQTNKSSVSEVTRDSSSLSISLLAGAPLTLNGGLGVGLPAYGVHVSKRILGPISVGAFGFSNGLAGVSVGLSF